MIRRLAPLYHWARARAAARGPRLGPVRLAEAAGLAVFFPHRLGDLVLASPTIEALALAAAGRPVALLCRPGLASLAGRIPGPDRVISVSAGTPPEDVARRLREALPAGSAFVDLTADEDLQGVRIARALGWPAAGFTTRGRGRIFGTRFGSARTPEHFWRVVARAADHLCPGVPVGLPRLFPRPADREAAERHLGLGPADRALPRVALVPGGTYPSQRWPAERFGRVADELARRANARVFAFGTPGEGNLVRTAAGTTGAAVCDLDPSRLVDAMGLMDLVISNNTGPLHLAAALGVPTVSLLGPTDPVRFWPLGAENRVLCPPVPCRPCGRGACPDHRCLAAIGEGEVLAPALEILGAAPGPSNPLRDEPEGAER